MQRNEDLDFLRGIGIVFVVLGHCFTTALLTKYSILGVWKDIIYTFHMPLFFIISGYIQGLRPYTIIKLKSYSLNQVKRLFVPYLVWSFFLYIFYFFLNKVGIFTMAENIILNPLSLIKSILAYDVRTGNVLWFTYILFIICLVSYFIHIFIKGKFTNIIFLIIVLCLGFFANTYLQDEMYVFKRFLVMWIYYETGVFIGIYIRNIDIRVNSIINIFLAGLYALMYTLYSKSSGLSGLSLKIICALLAVLILYSLSKYNNNLVYKVLNYIGKRTSFIYYLHNPYIVLVLTTGLSAYTGLNAIASMITAFLLGILLPLLFGELIMMRNKIFKVLLLGEKV